MKKKYLKPATEAFDIQASQILCASKSSPSRWGGEFGQVPGLNAIDKDMMA